MIKTEILIGLFVCHWLADFTHLSTDWMLSAKKFGKSLFPILCHAFVHALLMGVFLEIYYYSQLRNYNPIDFNFTFIDKLIVFQLATHFLIDVWKGRMNGWFPALQSPANKWHWVVFGFDQLLHGIVIILMALHATNQL